MNPESWDVLYTSVGASEVRLMSRLFRQKRFGDGRLHSIDLRGLEYFGSYGYVVNGRSKRKLLDLLGPPATLDRPHDLRMRDLVESGEIRAFMLFPFLTALSEHADQSAIQSSDRRHLNLVWALFGRMMWFDGGAASIGPQLAAIEGGLDEDARAMGLLLAALAAMSRN